MCIVYVTIRSILDHFNPVADQGYSRRVLIFHCAMQGVVHRGGGLKPSSNGRPVHLKRLPIVNRRDQCGHLGLQVRGGKRGGRRGRGGGGEEGREEGKRRRRGRGGGGEVEEEGKRRRRREGVGRRGGTRRGEGSMRVEGEEGREEGKEKEERSYEGRRGQGEGDGGG